MGENMSRISVISHEGKNIIYIDFSNMKTSQKEEVYKLFNDANALISKNLPKSARIVTNLTNLGFDKEMSNGFKIYASNNTPYVKASALVGVTGLQKVILTIVKTFTKREFYLANNIEDAKNWVSKE
jgi:hypothetical protein